MKILLESDNGGGHIQIEGSLDFCSNITQNIFQGLGNYEISELEKNNRKPNKTIHKPNKAMEKPNSTKKDSQKNHDKVTEKRCPKCDKTKPVSDFNKASHDHTGYQSYCRDCSNKIRLLYHEKQERYKDRFNFVEPEKQPAINQETQPAINQEKQPEKPRIDPKTVFQWTPAKDKILRNNFNELGVSGIFDKILLPGFGLTEIRHRCQELGLIDQFGLKKESRKEDKNKEKMVL